MTWVAYHSDLSEVAVFAAAVEPRDAEAPEAVELRARRYAMENHMDVVDLADGAGLNETINAHLHNPEPSLLESDLAALVRETLDLRGCLKFYVRTAADYVTIERYAPGDQTIKAQGEDLSQALIDYRIKEARQNG